MSKSLEFKTDRLLLRPVTGNDITAYEKNFVDYRVIRHLSSRVPWPYPENGVRDWVQNHIIPGQSDNHWFWGIFLLSQPAELIGGIELWRPGTPENRGFWLGYAHWGKGYMTEAAGRITDFAFNEAGFEELVFSNAKGNQRSSRIKQKTGARYLRSEPGCFFVDPQYSEREIWLLGKAEWKRN